jgi:hypothetical protein
VKVPIGQAVLGASRAATPRRNRGTLGQQKTLFFLDAMQLPRKRQSLAQGIACGRGQRFQPPQQPHAFA